MEGTTFGQKTNKGTKKLRFQKMEETRQRSKEKNMFYHTFQESYMF
jgi:hypothetical protein